MNDSIVSPNTLWRDFNPELKNPDLSVFYKGKQGSVFVEKLYFTATDTEDGKIRVYCELRYTQAAKDRFDDKIPVVILSGDIKSEYIKQTEEKLLERQFAVLTYDFFGFQDDGRYTLYPKSLSYANLKNSVDKLYSVADTPKNTCWYVWHAVTRYLISAVEHMAYLDSSRMAILGIGYGANIAYQIAAMDDRINTAVIIGEPKGAGFGIGYDSGGASQTGIFDEELSRFIYSLSSQAYAKLVKKPVLVQLYTNAADSGFDRGMETFSRLSGGLKHFLSVSPYLRRSIGYYQRENIFKWLDCHLLRDSTFPSIPLIELYNSEDKLYAKLKADTDYKISNVKLYYAYNSLDGAVRNWYTLKVSGIGEGEYLTKLDVVMNEQPVYVFGIVNYENGISASTKLIQKNTKGMNLTLSQSSSRLIYDSKNRYDCFCIAKPARLFDSGKELAICEGPLGLTGIKSLVGHLATFKLADQKYYGYDNDLLQMSVYSVEPQEITIALHEFSNGRWGRIFSAREYLTGGEIWQKITLSPHDFKTPEGYILENWEDMAWLIIKKQKELLLHSLIWA